MIDSSEPPSVTDIIQNSTKVWNWVLHNTVLWGFSPLFNGVVAEIQLSCLRSTFTPDAIYCLTNEYITIFDYLKIHQLYSLQSAEVRGMFRLFVYRQITKLVYFCLLWCCYSFYTCLLFLQNIPWLSFFFKIFFSWIAKYISCYHVARVLLFY